MEHGKRLELQINTKERDYKVSNEERIKALFSAKPETRSGRHG